MISLRYLFQITNSVCGAGWIHIIQGSDQLFATYAGTHERYAAAGSRKKAGAWRVFCVYGRQRSAQKLYVPISGIPQSFVMKHMACLNIVMNTYAAS
jgi:hypothetical protein